MNTPEKDRRYMNMPEKDTDSVFWKDYVDLIFANLEKRFTERQTTLDVHYDSRFDSLKEASSSALNAASLAVAKAEMAAEKRFESVNEFRSTLADQQRNLMPRSEVDVMFKSMVEKITTLEKQIDRLLAERQGIKGGWGYAVGMIGVILTLGSLITMAVGLFSHNPK